MGGGNAQKSATARARNQAKAETSKNAGGGKDGMAQRKGTNMAEAMAEAQAKRAEIAKLREEGKKIPQPNPKKG
eukprot:CAMPEP_0196765564 /NCGR_PEP_ID=MMETSP1095-20130614/9674_1 /TAXON_ID=96789 ORGANISM="Chromulina nebulosa, Strain UTEXLB2642" /NCGR_SAMPLE_ID=MMETSP1095 /ASSEMBLY_ACC=CAM_ASM_000446 /LENGTH=73 /DNA_ID=CAMNT_0042123825 /DNA_START=47 /DNA_END=268 /DNA_ORIENTATION=+